MCGRNLVLISLLAALYACTTPADQAPPDSNQLVTMAELGDISALHKVCYSYHRGKNGFPQNYQKAFVWCTNAANKGIPSSQTLLAEIYFLGLGIDIDYAQAFIWYNKPARNNHPHAQFMLAQIYFEGLGVTTKNPQEGMRWLKKAAENGHKKAQEQLRELSHKSSPSAN